MLCVECNRPFIGWGIPNLPEICGSCLDDETREIYKAKRDEHLERILAPPQLSKWCEGCHDLGAYDCQGYYLSKGETDSDQPPNCYV